MNTRWGEVVTVVLFILIACPAIYLWFTSAGMGYPPSTAAIIAGIPALVGLAILPYLLRRKR
jgi:hypothetical protein